MRWLAPTCVAVASACGRLDFDVRAATSDAAVDAGPGVVTVTTNARGTSGRTPAVVVWTNTVAGDVDDMQLTDASGSATLHLEPGGAVSAAYSPAQEGVLASWSVHSILGAQPGESFQFGAPSSCSFTPRGSATVTFGAAAAATSYQLATACQRWAMPASPYVWSLTSSDPDPADVTLLGLDAGGALAASATHVATATPDGAALTFTAGEWAAPQLATIGLSGIPADLPNGSVSATFAVGATSIAAWSVYASPAIVTGVMSASLAGPASSTRISVRLHAMAPGFSDGVEYTPAPGAAASHALPPLPPRIATSQFAVATRAITWMTVAPGVVGDRVEAQLFLQTTAGDGMSWTVWGPPTSPQLVLPRVPSTISDFAPASTSYPSVQIIDYPDQQGWDASRLAPEWDSPSLEMEHEHVATLALPPTA